MSKSLYEEALVDVAKLREIAIDKARAEILEELTPQIKEFVDDQLYSNVDDVDDSADDNTIENTSDTTEFVSDDSTLDALVAAAEEQGVISQPDEEGKVTLDVDQVAQLSDDVVVDDQAALDTLSPVVNDDDIEASISELRNEITQHKNVTSPLIREGKVYKTSIERLENNARCIYDFVAKNITSKKKNVFEAALKKVIEDLGKLQENNMKRRSLASLMNEEDVTLKLTGLPDDVDLESVGVDLITGGDESSDESSDEDLDLDVTDDDASDVEGTDEVADSGESSDDELDLSDLDFGDDSSEKETTQAESHNRRGRRLHEEVIASDDEGELILQSDEEDEGVLGETDEESSPDFSGDEIERLRSERVNLRLEAAKARRAGNHKKYSAIIAESARITRVISDMVQRKTRTRRENNARPSLAESKLRAKLTGLNLYNAKLAYANKILTNESLSASQKKSLIKRIDVRKTVAEVKAVYELGIETFKRTALTESAAKRNAMVIGGSTPTRSGTAPVVEEGVEIERWQKLAGLK